LRRTYGLSLEEFDSMLKRQEGTCAIPACDAPATDVDHDHDTGELRDLLCGSCNRALGLAKESPAILRGMAEYLTSHK
jgi:hypothetical protein